MRERSKTCIEVRASLPLYVGRDLEPTELEELGEHLADCAECRAELRAAERARAALLSLHAAHVDEPAAAALLPAALGLHDTAPPADEPELDLWPGIRAELAREGLLREPVAAAPVERPRPALRLLTGGLWKPAAAAAALALAWLALFGGSRDDATSPRDLANGSGAVVPAQPVVDRATPSGSSVALVPVPSESASSADEGGLRRIDFSEGLRHVARDYMADTPVFLPVQPGSPARRENPNVPVGFH